MKRTSLLRRTPLRRSRRQAADSNPERLAWKTPQAGFCACGCGRFSMNLDRHHVIYQQHVRAEHGNEWDPHNAMLLARPCHTNHHSAFRPIKLEAIPENALAFAVDLLGEDKAILYLRRRYDCSTT